ncbi:uncharacterized protein isoform X2 [Rhodnius prolixus]|uniref:uncharacterized protein isoform X2 n=1 Tax=Rhodnius prolixus TaxID=13249 RepID=UPI003D18DCF4
MSESFNLSSNSSFGSLTEFSLKMTDDPAINVITNSRTGSNPGPLDCGLTAHSITSGTTTHPGYKSLLDALDFLRTLQTPIEFAYYLHEINDYLKDVVTRKENRLRKRVLNETAGASDAASVVSFRIQALQEQYYSSFYGKTTNLNGTSCNSIANSIFHPSQNSVLVSQRNEVQDTLCTIPPNRSQCGRQPHREKLQESLNNPQRFPAPGQPFSCQSSLFDKSRNLTNNSVHLRNGKHTENSFRNLQKFSAMEDTLRSGQSVNSIIENSKNMSRRAIKPGPLHSSLGISRNNISSFQNNCSALRESDFIQNCSSRSEIEGDQFSCVRIGPLSKKFHLPAVQEIEEESESVSSLSSSEDEEHVKNIKSDNKLKVPFQKEPSNKSKVKESSTDIKRGVQTNLGKKKESNLQKNSLGNENSTIKANSSPKEFILTNWTILLINGKLHLKGTKIVKKKITEKNHLSKEIICRARNGVIRTRDDCSYSLEPPFLDNEDMPEKVKRFFRAKKFPSKWRSMLSIWIEEKGRKSEAGTKVLLQQQTSPQGKSSKQIRNRSNKKTVSSETAEKKTEPAKTRNASGDLNDDAELSSSSQEKISKQVRNNANKKTASSGTIRKKTEPAKTKKVSEGLNNDTESSSSCEESFNEERNMKKTTKNKPKLLDSGGGSGKKIKRNKNCFEDFEESILNSSKREKNNYTPSVLLRSITSSSKLPIGRHTPPIKLIGEMIKQKNLKSKTINSSSEIGTENYVVAKRIKKRKGNKQVTQKKPQDENPAEDEVQNLLVALTNKTPQTTPKAVREVFRSKEESKNSDSDFGSDVSSI